MPVVRLHPESQPSSAASSLHNSTLSSSSSSLNNHNHNHNHNHNYNRQCDSSDSLTFTRHDRNYRNQEKHSPPSSSRSPPSPHLSPQTQAHKMSLYPMRLYSSERPPSPLALTSSIAPPSLMPTTASGSSTTPRSKPSANLKLSMLPTNSGTSSGASSTTTTPPNFHYAAYAHSLSTQQKLQLHQREIISSATRATGIPAHLLSSGPMSPKLIPLGSPGGPVTPLMLEQERDGNYFAGHELAGERLAYVGRS
ncbi:hypothetical protein FN846DRAFT_940064 [Sphaerosporella brunnea]|uniref:Uncharacterized protein n=1 Tax=Sphaerosporella brunnea TaxID=1250544 RepID=A0A5J5F212_9PEZI|nr:hypothetical protein FN846DRAFT_940064 [Sphaerosporella brunnea]